MSGQHTHTPLNNVKNDSSVSDGTAASPYTVQPQLELMQKCFSVVKVCVCVCVYNLWTCTVSVWVGVNVFKHCGFLIITSMGGFLLHQRIVCRLHECVCVYLSVYVSLCVYCIKG